MKIENLINLTPYNINIVCGDKIVTIPKSGVVARVKETQKGIRTISINNNDDSIVDIEIVKKEFLEVENLPDENSDKLYIVSSIVKSHQSCINRDDVIVPDCLVRNEKGQPLGCKGFYS